MKKPTEHDNNRVVDELEHYYKLRHAIADYPFLDNIVFGVCNLDMGGNSRPLNQNQFFILLANQRIISVVNVMEAHWCGKRQAQNICQALRIASREFVKQLDLRNKSDN